ncbi:hypothetical protein DY000_02007461 [Brassica cretica]|uniref:Uncharacterized protein n=1 Tax=Brassica cretica TaxID=69181 RepID=A0ABQ7BXU6_BRACR|nr:hypothetical protein DY000_02007461 [Brassica cretica]
MVVGRNCLNICSKYLIKTLVLISTTQHISLSSNFVSQTGPIPESTDPTYYISLLFPLPLVPSSLPFSSLLSPFDLFPLFLSLPLFSSSQIQKVKMEPQKRKMEKVKMEVASGSSTRRRNSGRGFGIVDEEAKFWSEILYLWLLGEYNARLD